MTLKGGHATPRRVNCSTPSSYLPAISRAMADDEDLAGFIAAVAALKLEHSDDPTFNAN